MGVDPVTASLVVGTGAAVGGSLLQAKGEIEDAEAAAEAAEYNRLLTLREGRIEEARRRRLARRELSSQRAAFGASGVRLEGSPLEFLADNAAELERDSVEVGISSRLSADLDRRRIRNIRRQGQRAASAALLQGLGQAAGGLGGFLGGGGGGATGGSIPGSAIQGGAFSAASAGRRLPRGVR